MKKEIKIDHQKQIELVAENLARILIQQARLRISPDNNLKEKARCGHE